MAQDDRLQELFLQELEKEKVPVSIFLVNGIKLHGMIGAFDKCSIMLQNSVTQMVFKHAISTIVPSHTIKIPAGKTE